MQPFVHLSIVFCLLTALQNPRSKSPNFLVFYTSWGISSRIEVFLFCQYQLSTIFVYNLPRQCTSNNDRSNKRNWFDAKNGEKQTIPHKSITDANSEDDIALLANTAAQAESLLHNLEQTAGGIDLHMRRGLLSIISDK